ncbi:MalY/PatB family protein [Alkalicoccobacillus plakortidis]|uniref:cysteine-S-conjugate beta-lyase n=1 Tax=Alkalicoccobacillus plakortidis TaxID=444060 RepID=A0ABT0XHI9_9BACI|nr:MalY/PatB family protein [Alkalicoccobacillus plakortidis]MCM2675376.1 pyridoxal phosphate-dependent aminotransferase [Alkalicoccobacillus plakortidis]
MYRFDEVIERKGTNSLKWDGLEQRYGASDLLPMWVADMDFKAPQPVLDALTNRVQQGVFGYITPSSSVNEAIVNWASRRYEWEIDSSSIVHTVGIVPTISNLVKVFTEPGDEVIIQTPVYYPFYDVISKNDRSIVRNPLLQDENGQFTMDLTQLEASITEKTKMLVFCHPHNPGGRVWSRQELEELAALCKKYDLLVVSDEIHADLLFDGYNHIPFASINEDMADRTFTCLAPTKTFNLAGIIASYIVIQNKKRRLDLKRYLESTFMNSPNSFAALATEVAYNEGEEWLHELMQYVQQNYQFTADFIHTNMPKINVIKPQGTYLLWLDFSQLPLEADERKQWLVEEAKVALNHGPMFGEEAENFERLNLACPREILQKGLNQIKQAYEKQQF